MLPVRTAVVRVAAIKAADRLQRLPITAAVGTDALADAGTSVASTAILAKGGGAKPAATAADDAA